MRYYCGVDKCWATYPCSIHTTMGEMLEEFTSYVPSEPIVKEIENIRVITVIPLPCGHNYPEPAEKKEFNAICEFCDSQFWIKIKSDVCELTRIS